MNEIVCLVCGSQTERDVVDIGVGEIYSPMRCNSCGWSEEGEKAQDLLRILGWKAKE